MGVSGGGRVLCQCRMGPAILVHGGATAAAQCCPEDGTLSLWLGRSSDTQRKASRRDSDILCRRHAPTGGPHSPRSRHLPPVWNAASPRGGNVRSPPVRWAGYLRRAPAGPRYETLTDMSPARGASGPIHREWRRGRLISTTALRRGGRCRAHVGSTHLSGSASLRRRIYPLH